MNDETTKLAQVPARTHYQPPPTWQFPANGVMLSTDELIARERGRLELGAECDELAKRVADLTDRNRRLEEWAKNSTEKCLTLGDQVGSLLAKITELESAHAEDARVLGDIDAENDRLIAEVAALKSKKKAKTEKPMMAFGKGEKK